MENPRNWLEDEQAYDEAEAEAEAERAREEEGGPEAKMVEGLKDLVESISYLDEEDLYGAGLGESALQFLGADVSTFDEAGILTFNEDGLVIRANGRQFQISVVSRPDRW